MTTAQDYFIDALAAKVAAEPLIRAAWLAGSFGKETADRWSDVDAHLLLDTDALHEFRGEVETGWARSVLWYLCALCLTVR